MSSINYFLNQDTASVDLQSQIDTLNSTVYFRDGTDALTGQMNADGNNVVNVDNLEVNEQKTAPTTAISGNVAIFAKTDKLLYSVDDGGTERVITNTTSGDVVGPASATDNTIARFDSTTGKLIQDSGVTIDDSDNITTVGTLSFSAISGGLPTGLGDVVGPAVSVDNTLPRFDSTTGKLIQASGVTVDDSDNIATTGTLSFSAISGGLPTGLGDVVGPASATDNSFVRYDSTTGKLVQDSVIGADDSGNITKSGADFIHTNGGVNNLAVGAGSLAAVTTGTNNTVIGTNSMASNTEGLQNISIGTQTLNSNISGNNNVVVGYQSMLDNTTGGDNTAVGHVSMTSNIGGSRNAAFGFRSLSSNETGAQNVAIGGESLRTSVTTSQITAVGYRALELATTGAANTAVGFASQATNTTGARNTSVGFNSAFTNSAGDDNTAIGYLALNVNTDSDNTAVGANSLAANTTGTSNTALGKDAGLNLTTGDNNIFIGESAGSIYTTEDNNVAIATTGNSGDDAVIRIGTLDTHQTFLAGYKTQTGPTIDGGDTVSLTPQESGSLYYILQRTSNTQINLPFLDSIGCHYKFFIGVRSADVVTVTFSANSTYLYGTITDPGGVTQINGSTNLIFGTTAGVGDSVEFHAYDSTVWLVKAVTSTTGAITVT